MTLWDQTTPTKAVVDRLVTPAESNSGDEPSPWRPDYCDPGVATTLLDATTGGGSAVLALWNGALICQRVRTKGGRIIGRHKGISTIREDCKPIRLTGDLRQRRSELADNRNGIAGRLTSRRRERSCLRRSTRGDWPYTQKRQTEA